ncbi:hypothetical protein [Kordiimonas sp. SCSIO 12610]|uniref:hypothetical protein n=1 Tax=Kordiimonas sp. SCSIO 12610 TaxID=2829597 RepID=UPI00210A017E|nr:hypothetical protein [Kordiimonas sp. SCSIO 12610]UTW56543.1 hypothetical protein KFF44_06490 [Kordiimonas sp. SCSIO 12610]
MNPATRILVTIFIVTFILMFVVIYPIVTDVSETRRKDAAFFDETLIPQTIVPLTLTSTAPFRVIPIDALESDFDQVSITTSTYFTGDEIHTFSGPRVMDVLNLYAENDVLPRLSASASIKAGTSYWDDKEIIAAAGDDYDIRIPITEVLEKFNPIIATQMDGKPLPEEYAPLFIVFDRDGIEDLDNTYTQYWVWSLTRMHIAVK